MMRLRSTALRALLRGERQPPHRTLATAPARSSTRTQRSAASTWVLFGVPIATTFSLGVWQVKRLGRKQNLIADREARLAGEELSSTDLFTHPDPDYRRVRIRGTLLHEREMLVGPRAAPKDLPTPILQWGGSSGLQVVTPMRLADGGVVLVNRGWIPQRLAERKRRGSAAVTPHPFMLSVDENTPMQTYDDAAVASNEVEVVGVVRRGDERNRFTPANRPEEGKWYFIEPGKMLAGEPEVVVEVLAPLPTGGWPHPRGQGEHMTFRTPPSTHVTYAATWFSLSAAIAMLTRYRARVRR